MHIPVLNPKSLRSAYDMKAICSLDGDVKPLVLINKSRLMLGLGLTFTFPHITFITHTLHYNTTLIVFSHTLTLFWLRKTSMIVKTYQLSFHVFICAFIRRSLHISVSFLFIFLFLCLLRLYIYSCLTSPHTCRYTSSYNVASRSGAEIEKGPHSRL